MSPLAVSCYMFHSKPLLQQGGPSASLAAGFFLTHFPYVKIKSKSTFVLKHDPSESNETTFEVARFLVFYVMAFFLEIST